MRSVLLVTLLILSSAQALPQIGPVGSNIEQQVREWACAPDDLAEASEKLRKLYDADQTARTVSPPNFDEDIARRVEVAAIYARGCLQRAEDFHHAALIFQHGNSPEHYYQAWYFATRAVAMGDESAEWLIPRAIDRYLLNIGQKQLFGTNTVTPYLWDSESEEQYFCLWPVEDELPDKLRDRYKIPLLADKRESVAARLDPALGLQTGECPVEVPSPSKGLFPGIW